jgi:ribosomal protein RSM22 (predicted rRNA methylase)
VTAIDRDAAALALLDAAARHLAAALGGRIELTRHAGDLARADLAPGAFDLVLAGTVLNELPDQAGRIALVTRALAALSGGGALVLIEPALRDTSRDLHLLRDDLLARGAAHVFAPCTRAVAPCPALADPRDWCHEVRPLDLPPRAAQVALVTGLRDDGMKLSYLVLRRGAEPLAPTAPGRAALRLVSPPTKLKGRRECVACGAGGWSRLRLLTRHRDDANRAFERARRGDVVVVDDRPAEPGAPRDIGAGEQVDVQTTRR